LLDRVGAIVGEASEEEMNMRNWSAVALVLALAAPAFADATADARAHDEAFAKACEAGDVKAVLALYADDAVVVWPGAGEEAKGKAAIEKLIPGLCDPKSNTKAVIKSLQGTSLGDSHILIIGHWEVTQTGPDGKPTTSQIRATEVIAKTGSGWRYVLDHASIGLPPPAAAKKHEPKAEHKK
jgi:uncharacterized protein (TIGR02246 family)